MTAKCDEWEGTTWGGGYGCLFIAVVEGHKSGQFYAHRIVWAQDNGHIPDGLHVCHTCDNPRCINIDHLFLGSRSDNMRDMVEKGRHGNQFKGVCNKGHALEQYPNGAWRCRKCHNQMNRERREQKRRAEGRPVANARKTHCPQGHAYDSENTRLTPQGHRICRECQRLHDKKRRNAAHAATIGAKVRDC